MKSVSPLTVFSLVQNFNWHLLKPVIPRRGERVQPFFFFLDRRFHWLIDYWIFWVGGGGRGGDCKFELRETIRNFKISNTPPRLDERGRELCHSFCASVGLTSFERSCCFSFVLLVFRYVFTHHRKNLFFVWHLGLSVSLGLWLSK